jgi:hypothetical protein
MLLQAILILFCNSRNKEVKTIEKVIVEIFHLLTKNSRSFCHEKTVKTHSFVKRGRAKAQERRELGTLAERIYLRKFKFRNQGCCRGL